MGLQYVLLEKHMKLKFSDNQKKLQFYLSWSDVLHFLPALSTLTHVHLTPTLHLHLHPPSPPPPPPGPRPAVYQQAPFPVSLLETTVDYYM